MKRFLTLLTVFSIIAQFCFVVQGEETTAYLEFDAKTLAEAPSYNTKCVSVKQDEKGEEYLLLHDTNTSAECGIQISTGTPTADYVTMDFDYFLEKNSRAGLRFFWNSTIGNCVDLTLFDRPSHNPGNAGGSNTAATNLQAGCWEHITVVLNKNAKSYNVYLNGALIGEGFKLGNNNAFEGDTNLIIVGDKGIDTKAGIKNMKFYNGAVVPEEAPEMSLRKTNPERRLVDYSNAKLRMDAALDGAVAMTIGNSVARVNNSYVNIYEGEPYVAPYISADGSTLIPARFATEAIGCEVEVVSLTSFKIHKDGTTIEFNIGDKNAVINGEIVEMPTAPVITKDRLFVPLRFAAETFGKNVFWDDRGLIIISDGEVISEGEEDIIKPLISDIRNRSGAFGNKKYSDVSMSSRSYGDGARSTLEATKNFMATVDRWTYTIDGVGLDRMIDQGTFVHGTVNANVRDGDEEPNTGTAQFFDGTWYMRADGANGTTWGCVSNPIYRNNVLARAKRGIDGNLFMWQFDDWHLALNYQMGGCFCDYCTTGFTAYLQKHANDADIRDLLAKAEFGDLDTFDFKKWMQARGVKTNGEVTVYTAVNTPTGDLWRKFNEERILEFHLWLRSEMEAYSGGRISYSLNTNSSFTTMATNNDIQPWNIHMIDLSDGTMGEAGDSLMTSTAVFASMLLNKAMGVENCISPWPKNEHIEQMMVTAIPMIYATGQFMLVPWGAWLFGSTRYYGTAEELKGLYEFVRKYPHLFDNYEIPEKIGYVMDLQTTNVTDANKLPEELLESGAPARLLLHRDGKYGSMTFDTDDLKGLSAIVAATDITNLTEEEKTTLQTCGIPFIEKSDTEGCRAVEDKYWTVRNDESDIYTILRTNQLYDDAPVIVHAVNYIYDAVRDNVEIEINNKYLPAGDIIDVKVYRPNNNPYTIKVRKGEGSTKITIDKMEFWSVLEIMGTNTTRRLSSFDIGGDYSGIGLGTRVSNDKAYGTSENFNIITYSEGINSTTLGDIGCQDEAAFIYKHLGKSNIKSFSAVAGFEEADGTHGVMIRDSVRSNVKFAAIMYDSDNGLRFAHRDYLDKNVVYEKIQNAEHDYMRLEKTAAKIEAYTSADGENWEKVYEYTLNMADPVAGVFASSPDGRCCVHTVKDFVINEEELAGKDLGTFQINYKDGRISDREKGERMEISLLAKDNSSISLDDVEIAFNSSDESVAELTSNGFIIPKSPGNVTVTATAKMGLYSINAETNLEVYTARKEMFTANFDDESEFDLFETAGEEGNVTLVDGAVRLTAKDEGGAARTGYMHFPQVANQNAYFEFDFRAHFGETQPTTGAGVLYGNNDGFAMTCDVNEFNWFFDTDQRFVVPMEGDKWYHIKIFINYGEQYANVWVDDNMIVEKGELKNYAEQTGTFLIRSWRLGLDTYYEWDNFNFHLE